jgi:hypothetical protein
MQARTSRIMRFHSLMTGRTPVPADPASPIPAALTQLTHTDPRQLQNAEASHLLAYLAAVPDPRAARGRRHPTPATHADPCRPLATLGIRFG